MTIRLIKKRHTEQEHVRWYFTCTDCKETWVGLADAEEHKCEEKGKRRAKSFINPTSGKHISD